MHSLRLPTLVETKSGSTRSNPDFARGGDVPVLLLQSGFGCVELRSCTRLRRPSTSSLASRF